MKESEKEGDFVEMTLDEIKRSSYSEIKDKNVVVEIEPQQIMEEYLSDENNTKRLDELALQFNTFTRGNWFFAEDLRKKVLKDMQTHLNFYLDLLVMSKRAFVKKQGETLRYKNTLNKNQRIQVLKNYINELDEKKKQIENELAELHN